MTTQTGNHFNPFPLIALWSPKGGVGTSVTAAVLALALARRIDTVLIDAAGDQTAIFSKASAAVGFADWVAGGDSVPVDSLNRLTIDVANNLRLVPSGSVRKFDSAVSTERIRASFPSTAVVLDLGCVRDTSDAHAEFAIGADQSLMVLRPCYLAAQRGLAGNVRRDGIVFLNEPGRVLRAKDIADVLNTEVVATVDLDPAVARLVDAGRLTRRLPRSVRPLEQLAATLLPKELRRAS